MTDSAAKPQPRNDLATYKRLLSYAAPYWKMFTVAVIGMAVFASADVSFIYLVKPLLDGSFVEQDPAIIKIMPIAIVILFVLRGISAFASEYGMAWVGRRVIRDMRGNLFNHIVTLPVSFYDRVTSGKLITKLVYHVEQVAEATTSVVTSIIKEGLTVVGLFGLMFFLNAKLTLFTLIVGPIIALLVRYVSKRFRKISTRIQDSMGGITHVAEEAIKGQRVVKIYNGEDFERASFSRANEENRRQVLKLVATSSGSSGVIQFIAAWAVAGVVFFATRPDMLAEITPGTFVSYLGAMLSLLRPIKALTTVNERLQRGIAAAGDLFDLLEEPPEHQGGSKRIERSHGDIEFKNVKFAYTESGEIVLEDISLTVKAGESAAFVGRSGSGKSTLLSLLPRFYDTTAGSIEIDGIDIREYFLPDLRRQIAFVDQQIVLFNATIAENIAYGLEKLPTRDQLISAAKDAYAWEFIEKLPQGLDTPVGQQGMLLSGGQRQRIAIARALLKNAPILILDEATSALDTESERYIQKALERLMKGRTTLTIAHRLSTIQQADLIVAMQDGRIIERGSHDELLNQKGLYASLYQMQFEAENKDDANDA